MNELTISLDPHRKTPLYEQIYGFIREEIRGGRIRAGERLPSARALSGYLSVSRSTVDLAYEQLVSEGYLESVPCKGYFVCEIEGLYRLDEKKEETKEDDTAEQMPFRYDFAVTGTAPGGFPQNSWKKISKEVLLDADDSLFQLGDAKGEHGLREAIRDYLHHARGVNCRTEQIIVGAGNDYLLMLLSVILGRGHKVAMENPTYISAYRCFAKLGYAMCTISMDEAGMRPAELEKSGADLAYIMPSHQFPMGMVMPMKRRMQLLVWASRENGRYLIEDDYDSEFRYKGRPIPALQGNDTEGKVIYLGTFSRAVEHGQLGAAARLNRLGKIGKLRFHLFAVGAYLRGVAYGGTAAAHFLGGVLPQGAHVAGIGAAGIRQRSHLGQGCGCCRVKSSASAWRGPSCGEVNGSCSMCRPAMWTASTRV